jgi:hypothetical protein
VKNCPRCGQGIDLKRYWVRTPRTRLGFPAGAALNGRPGLLCPRCGGAAAISTVPLSGVTVLLWSAVGIGVLAMPGLERLPTLARFSTVAAVVGVAFLIQRAAAPLLLELQLPDDGEKLNIVDSRK